jgi:hypothetical protein
MLVSKVYFSREIMKAAPVLFAGRVGEAGNEAR